jgi:hypothetical protein
MKNLGQMYGTVLVYGMQSSFEVLIRDDVYGKHGCMGAPSLCPPNKEHGLTSFKIFYYCNIVFEQNTLPYLIPYRAACLPHLNLIPITIGSDTIFDFTSKGPVREYLTSFAPVPVPSCFYQFTFAEIIFRCCFFL